MFNEATEPNEPTFHSTGIVPISVSLNLPEPTTSPETFTPVTPHPSAAGLNFPATAPTLNSEALRLGLPRLVLPRAHVSWPQTPPLPIAPRPGPSAPFEGCRIFLTAEWASDQVHGHILNALIRSIQHSTVGQSTGGSPTIGTSTGIRSLPCLLLHLLDLASHL